MTREPWQMTLEQYAVEKGARPAWVKAGYGETYRFHKRAVERAIAEGKPVPTEVLKDYPTRIERPNRAQEEGNPNPMIDNFAIGVTMGLDLPEPIKQEWLTGLKNGSAPEIAKVKRLSNQNGRSAILVLWADERMTAIITDNKGTPYISETSRRDPEAFYIAAAFLQAEGLKVIE